jgi:hypothetical protein
MWSNLPNLLTIGRILLVPLPLMVWSLFIGCFALAFFAFDFRTDWLLDAGISIVAILTLAWLAVYMQRWLVHMGSGTSGGSL